MANSRPTNSPLPIATSRRIGWRAACALVMAAIAAWYVAWLALAYFASGGVEFVSDAPTFTLYFNDPSILLREVPRELFGASVASPLMPWGIAASAIVFKSTLPEFVAFRATMALHVLIGIAIGFGVAFRELGPPKGTRGWMTAALVGVLPVGWCASVIMSQDDCVSALWSGLTLLACVYSRPLVATVVVGLGIFFAKPFLAVSFLAIWICSPGQRLRVGAASLTFVASLFGFYLWRDGKLPFGEYMIAPFMGASPYGIAWLLLGEIEKPWMWWIKGFSFALTGVSFATFAWVATKYRTSIVSTSVGLYSLFFTFFLGIMPEYELWCVPFIVVLLWSAAVERRWSVFGLAWSHSLLGYAYKLVYGLNFRFEASGKPALKSWYQSTIGIDVQPLQIGLAVATVASSLALAIVILRRDPTATVPTFGRRASDLDSSIDTTRSTPAV